MRARQRPSRRWAAFAPSAYELSGAATPQLINGARLGAGVFPALGVAPLLGRVFTKQEDDGHAPVAVISYALWLNRYHRDPHVLGQSIELDRKSYSIVGVMPRSFEFPAASRPAEPGAGLGSAQPHRRRNCPIRTWAPGCIAWWRG